MDLFYELNLNCLIVLYNQVPPKQKRQKVNLIRQTDKAKTSAISDYDKDVGIITEANIGISLQGKDGTHGARASDFESNNFFI